MPHKQKKNEAARRRNRRIVFMGVMYCLCLVALLIRIGYLKYVNGEKYELIAVAQLITGRNETEQETNPNRGYILDRNKQPIAVSNRVYNVILDVTILDARTVNPDPLKDDKTRSLTALSEVLEIPMAQLQALFAKDADGNLVAPTNYKILARKISSADALKLKDLPCVYLIEDTERRYINPYLAPQTIGFLRGDSAWGLENQYNSELFGEKGRVFRTYDQDNYPATQTVVAQDGYTLITTLDAGIQRIAQEAVDAAAAQVACQAVSMMVMNPYTGEILAMAQWPSFSLADPDDPYLYTDKHLASIWDALSAEEQLNQKYKIWGNFGVTHSFEPGSIFKPMVVAAAIEEGVINTATDTFFCGAKIQVADWEIPCWSQYGHGGQNVEEVLMHSCNVGMIKIIQELGRDLFYKYRNDFGYGEKTDIDLPGEASVSSSAVMYTLSQLNPVELATSAMGQGFNNTAIQAITAFSAVINGGNLMKPYIVSQIVDEHGSVVKETTPTVVRKVISGSTSDYLRYAMQSVISEGTGKGAMIEGYSIGGKTGSGQQGADREGMTLSFMAYLPVENPEYIALAIIDQPDDTELTSSASVAPMMREALSGIIQYKNIRPSDETLDINAVRDDLADRSLLNDYSGMTLMEVTRNLNNLDIDYQVVGTGTVVNYHHPAAGQAAPKNAPLFLYMDPETQVEGEMTVVPDVEGLIMEQAEGFVSDAKLTPVTFIDKPKDNAEDVSGGDPVTYYPVQVGEVSGEGGTTESVLYQVYKQYPSPGAIVPRGTEIKLKVKPSS